MKLKPIGDLILVKEQEKIDKTINKNKKNNVMFSLLNILLNFLKLNKIKTTDKTK